MEIKIYAFVIGKSIGTIVPAREQMVQSFEIVVGDEESDGLKMTMMTMHGCYTKEMHKAGRVAGDDEEKEEKMNLESFEEDSWPITQY